MLQHTAAPNSDKVSAGRVEEGCGGLRNGESLLSEAFAAVPAPQSVPSLRLPTLLIEPDVRIYRIRLSDWYYTPGPTQAASPVALLAWGYALLLLNRTQVVGEGS